MRYAKQPHKEMAEAEPGSKAVCYGCGEEVFAKCGPILGWHWCHKSGSLCVNAATEPETNWHSSWKLEVPKRNREVTIKKAGRVKRADIKANTATVIELQHSEISRGELVDREDFYGRNMFWIFDSDGQSRQIRKSTIIRDKWNSFEPYEVCVSDRVSGIGGTGRPAFVDLHDYICRILPHVTNSGRRFQAIVLPAEQVRDAVRQTCCDAGATVANFFFDSVTDWMKQGSGKSSRRTAISKGQHIAEFCPHVGDLKKHHIKWLASVTEKTSSDYYSDGW